MFPVETPPRYIPTVEAARRLDVVQLTVRRWVYKGRLRGQRVGRSVVVEESSVTALEQVAAQ
jgi:excisionase family DNA binding protein